MEEEEEVDVSRLLEVRELNAIAVIDENVFEVSEVLVLMLLVMVLFMLRD